MAKNQKAVEEVAQDLFKKLGVTGDVEVIEGDEAIEVILAADDPGLIIGRHGDTLDSLQLILSLMVSKKIGEFKRVTLEVGDYKKNRTDYLKTLAEQTKDRVLTDGREIFLPNLKSWERRIVHLYLQDDKEVLSESVGEGRERTLVVKPR